MLMPEPCTGVVERLRTTIYVQAFQANCTLCRQPRCSVNQPEPRTSHPVVRLGQRVLRHPADPHLYMSFCRPARGLFFNEPETVINTAELLFETGDAHNARRLMIRAKEMDMNLLERIEALWATRLEPGFMTLVSATLTPHAAKVLLVAVTVTAAMVGLSPDVAFASKPIIVSGL